MTALTIGLAALGVLAWANVVRLLIFDLRVRRAAVRRREGRLP